MAFDRTLIKSVPAHHNHHTATPLKQSLASSHPQQAAKPEAVKQRSKLNSQTLSKWNINNCTTTITNRCCFKTSNMKKTRELSTFHNLWSHHPMESVPLKNDQLMVAIDLQIPQLSSIKVILTKATLLWNPLQAVEDWTLPMYRKLP